MRFVTFCYENFEKRHIVMIVDVNGQLDLNPINCPSASLSSQLFKNGTPHPYWIKVETT